MPRIDALLAALDERHIARRIGLRHDEARLRYPLQRNTVQTFDAFSTVIADYCNHHFTHCVSNGGTLATSEAAGRAKEMLEREYRRRHGDTDTFGLPPCAQRMLAQGVSEGQRVACFHLALQLRKAGLPEDIAVASLRAWARKNRPHGNRRIITVEEIVAQTRSAYGRAYRGCGCEAAAVRPFCDPDCPLQRHAQAAPALGATEVTRRSEQHHVPEALQGCP